MGFFEANQTTSKGSPSLTPHCRESFECLQFPRKSLRDMTYALKKNPYYDWNPSRVYMQNLSQIGEPLFPAWSDI